MTSNSNLAAILQDIVNENPDQQLLLNSYFRIPKNNPEFLKKYKPLKYSKNGYIATIRTLFTIPRMVLNLTISIFGSILLVNQYKSFKIKSKNATSLFISHATSNNLSGISDVYFADLPLFIGKQKCTILYLNHNKGKYKVNLARLNEKGNCANVLLIPKFLRPIEFAKYLNHCLELVKAQSRISYKYSKDDLFKAVTMIIGIYWIFSRESYNNFLIKQRIEEIYKQIKIDIAFFTLEGHSYEEVAVNCIRTKNGKAKFFFYQHSPITKAQKGVEYFLRNFEHSVTLLTTGSAYSRFLLQFSTQNNVFCIGSNKIFDLQVNPVTKIKTILIAPEGTSLASNQFIRYLIRMARKYQNYAFILRLHPNLKFDFFTTLLKMKLNKLENVQISNRSLLEDLQHSQATLYRSSTVALETLKIHNIPIFVDFTGDADLNVFSVIENNFPSVYGNYPQLESLESLNLLNFNFAVIDDLYIPFNPKKDLLDLIRN
jgi:hypothetical protein